MKNGITADGVEAMYRNAHAAIRADPARAEKPAKDIKVRQLCQLFYSCLICSGFVVTSAPQYTLSVLFNIHICQTISSAMD